MRRMAEGKASSAVPTQVRVAELAAGGGLQPGRVAAPGALPMRSAQACQEARNIAGLAEAGLES